MTDSAPTSTASATAITWVDTRAMDWERFVGFESGRVKPLYLDEDGNAMVMLAWLPPGDLQMPLPHRHLHRTVYECSYHVAGDLPHAEWETLEDRQQLVTFREGFFMNRAPRSLHGNEWLFSQSGATVLMWRSGTGNWLDDPDAPTETHILDPEPAAFERSRTEETLPASWGSGRVLDRPDVRIVSTREMTWEDIPEAPGARVKLLSVDQAGLPSARIVFLPPGEQAVPGLPTGPEDHELAYVIEGDLHVAGADGPELRRAGWFMHRAPGAPEGIVPAASSEVGAVVLQWRMGPTTFAPPQ
jgi:hypothetical protein